MRSVLLPYHLEASNSGCRAISWVSIWGPAILAVGVIAVESTRTFSAENTSGWLRPVIEAVLGRLNDTNWAELHHLLRKTGHFIGFGGVCVTFVRAWLWRTFAQILQSVGRWRWVAAVRGLASTAVVASLDEWHQTFLPNRTGRFADVVLDTCGGVVACLFLWLLFWRKDQKMF